MTNYREIEAWNLISEIDCILDKNAQNIYPGLMSGGGGVGGAHI
jgi:hypothetical protein